ncbi:unnamed protein product [Ectocarpus sp. 12 AP-2014]
MRHPRGISPTTCPLLPTAALSPCAAHRQSRAAGNYTISTRTNACRSGTTASATATRPTANVVVGFLQSWTSKQSSLWFGNLLPLQVAAVRLIRVFALLSKQLAEHSYFFPRATQKITNGNAARIHR